MVKQENKLEIMDDFTSGIKCFVAGVHGLKTITIEDLLKNALKTVIIPYEVSRRVI